MTSPVVTEMPPVPSAPASSSSVSATETAKGYVVAFVMPASKYKSAAELPRPTNPNVKLRDVLRRRRVPSVVVPPSLLKRRATGKGNADKAQMMAAARALGWDGDGDDQADAWLLWHGAREGWWA